MHDDRRDAWDLLTLGLWSIFFAIGIVPELAFYAVREIAAVPSYSALVNSSAVITLSFAVYLAFFAYRRCLASGLNPIPAQGKALEVGILALVAFLEIPSKGFVFQARTLLEVLLNAGDLPGLYLQTVVVFVGASKILAWLYLYTLVLRYHALGNRHVFARIPSIFPSMHRRGSGKTAAPTAEKPPIALPSTEAEDHPAKTEHG